jgi:glycosyltransferase involved in cell wall biosynthesis
VHYSHTLDPAGWIRDYENGLVPDKLPYGLDRIADYGIDLTVRSRPRSGVVRRQAERASRFMTGGFELPDLVRNRNERRAADVVLCWDERAGAFAAARSHFPGEPPVATGVVWMTDLERTGLDRRLPAIRGLASAACVYVNAPAQLDVLARWGVPPDRRHFIHMAVDADFWGAEPIEPELDLIVGAGNDRHRDHQLLVEAVRQLRARRPTARLELATHHPVDVPSGVGLRYPHRDHRQMRELYGRASVVALAVKQNLHLSGLTVVLEAMAAGRPVVVTEMPGIAEYVIQGETGFLVSRDAGAIVDALETVLADPERANEMGRLGRARVANRFTTRHLAGNLAALLHSVGK